MEATDIEQKVMDARQAVGRLFDVREADLSREWEGIKEIYDMAITLLHKVAQRRAA